MLPALFLYQLLLLVAVNCQNTDRRREPVPSPTQLIRDNGYPGEEHHVITSDGYKLTMHRIPYGRKRNCSASQCDEFPPVYLQHGLLCSSADFLVTGPDQALAYILADAGYDVWMGNCRGNTYSKKHIRLSPYQRKFWDFTWHEMGTIDVPEMIDYVLRYKNETSLHYVGHSQGTTTFFVAAATHPEFNGKIRGAHLLAPAAFMNHMRSPLIQNFAHLSNLAEVIFGLFGSGEFFATGDLLSVIGDNSCKMHAVTKVMCSNVLFLVVGFDSDQFNATLLPEITKRTPAGVSVKQILHFIQGVQRDRFCQYDYGVLGNLMKYRSKQSPEYDLRKVVAPTYLYYGENDWLVDSKKDVPKLKKILPNVQFDYPIPYPKWNHIDFLWGNNARVLLFDVLIENMRQSDNLIV